ncbi:Protein ENHANCER OF LHP1 1 [Linum perenne]
MKIRTLKLREVHKPNAYGANESSSFCSILWDNQARHLVTASSSDTGISIHDALLPSNTPKILRHHRDGVTALALSPNSTCLASGSVDNSVKLYKFPSGVFETNITRFTLPIRALAFNKSGSMLAAAGDDDGIKLINTVDGSIARILKGHRGSITGLAFDPIGDYLASIDSMGTVMFWELQSGTVLHTLKGVASNTGLDTSVANILSWSPDGETLAAPGLKNDVVMYDRDTAEKMFTLRGDHLLPICFLSWSPNGKFMATSSLDKQVLIWDVVKKQDIDRHKFEDRICSMAWKPVGNTLAVIDVSGKYGLWESVVPSSMRSPTEDIPLNSNKSNGVILFEEEGQEPSSSGSMSDLGEDSLGDSAPPSRKRIRKRSEFDEDQTENMLDDFSMHQQNVASKRAHYSAREHLNKGDEGLRSTMTSGKSKMQEAFQPGSTPVQPGKRRFLCYNMLGTITTMEYDGYSHIEIDFHDTSRGPRVPAMTDHFGFTMASLNENGSVFANPCKGDKNMSTLMYRPFSSWANNSEWSMRFEGEEVKVVALGTNWVAAITSLNYLRIFTEGGLQKHILSLDGPAVTASGCKNQLAVVTHAASSSDQNMQLLEFLVFDMQNGTKPSRGRLPLTPGSSLIWFGFSEEGQLSSYDSKGVLRVFTNHYGGSWFPLFSANKTKKPDENYWVAGLNARKLLCIVCKSPEVFPQVIPKPIITLLDLSFPLASSDLGAEALENEFIMNDLRLFQVSFYWQIQRRIEEGSSDSRYLDDEAFNTEAAQDRCILRLIATCCNSDKLARATELVKLLTLDKSVKGAIKLVTALKLPNLADRFNIILEERLLNETKEMSVPSKTEVPKAAAKLAVSQSSSAMARSGRSEGSDPVVSSSSAILSAPHFIRKVNRNEEVKGKDHNQTGTGLPKLPGKLNGGSIELKAAAGIAEPNVANSSEATGKEGVDQIKRSINPFKKSAK